jgi:ABC-type transporter Mla MlaB component
MLKISIQDEPNLVTMKLEGSLAGTWVIELEDSWRAVSPKLADRQLRLHLAEVQRVDTAGRYLLALLRDRGAHLTAEGVVMVEVVRTIAHDWPSSPAQAQDGRRRPSRRPLKPLM